MSITKRFKLKIARLTSTPSAAKIKAEIRLDNKRHVIANWFYQGQNGH
jgi:hypothetical protein